MKRWFIGLLAGMVMFITVPSIASTSIGFNVMSPKTIAFVNQKVNSHDPTITTNISPGLGSNYITNTTVPGLIDVYVGYDNTPVFVDNTTKLLHGHYEVGWRMYK